MITYTAFIDDMYRQEIEDVWEKNRMLSYEVLYDRLLDMTEFGKTVTSCLNRKQLIEVIEQHAARIFSFDDWDILLYEEPQKRFRSFSNTCYPLSEHPILEACTREYTSRKLLNFPQTKRQPSVSVPCMRHIPVPCFYSLSPIRGICLHCSA